MANKIILKKSSVAGKVPLATDLDVGEIAVNLADKALYSKDAGGTVIQLGGGSGSGDVVGPSSATDNALARFDATTGKLIQNSVGILDDSGNLSGITSITDINYVDFNTGYTTTLTAGQLGWDGNNTLGLGMIGGNVIQHIGEDQFFYCKASSAITKGQVVMFTGAVGASGVPKGAPATGISDGTYIMGVAAESIALNGFGLIQCFGTLRNVDTSAFADGDILWYDPAVTGGLTNTKPSAPNVKAQIAAVINGGSSGGGTILIRISPGSTLGGTDSNAQINGSSNGQFITYDGTGGYWKNTSLTAGTGISVSASSTGVVTITNSSPDQTVAISGTSPVSVTGTYPNFTVSMTQSSGSVNGWLSSTDWTTFNGKQTAYTNLSTIGALANGTGWLYNNGTGTFSYSTPTAADVGAVPTARTLTINGTTYDLSANRTWSVGTVTSVSALTIGTTGTDITSTVATGTTTPVITLNVPTASATNRGALSSTDWSTFNSKAPATSGTSILYGNGSGGFSNVTVGTGLSFSGGTLASTASGNTFSVYQFTATASQTTFAVGVSLSIIQVFVSGVLQKPTTDYTISGTDVVLASGVASGTIVSVYVYDTFNVANTYTIANADATFAPKASPTFTGTVTAATISAIANISTSGGLISDSKGDVRSAPINSQSGAYVLLSSDAGKTISITTGGVTVNASVFNAGDMVTIFNNSASSQNITQGASVTLRLTGTATTGTRALAQYGIATLLCVVGGATPTFACTGSGLT